MNSTNGLADPVQPDPAQPDPAQPDTKLPVPKLPDPKVAEPILVVDNLSVAFGKGAGAVWAVADVSLDVHAREIYALVGESGCGKSTLAYSLLGVVPEPGRVVGGDVRYRGQSLRSMSLNDLNHIRGAEIAMVFQAAMNAFNPVLTVGRHVEHSLKAHPDVFARPEEGRAYFEQLLVSLRLEPAKILGFLRKPAVGRNEAAGGHRPCSPAQTLGPGA